MSDGRTPGGGGGGGRRRKNSTTSKRGILSYTPPPIFGMRRHRFNVAKSSGLRYCNVARTMDTSFTPLHDKNTQLLKIHNCSRVCTWLVGKSHAARTHHVDHCKNAFEEAYYDLGEHKEYRYKGFFRKRTTHISEECSLPRETGEELCSRLSTKLTGISFRLFS